MPRKRISTLLVSSIAWSLAFKFIKPSARFYQSILINFFLIKQIIIWIFFHQKVLGVQCGTYVENSKNLAIYHFSTDDYYSLISDE